jgi:hypothetical protein
MGEGINEKCQLQNALVNILYSIPSLNRKIFKPSLQKRIWNKFILLLKSLSGEGIIFQEVPEKIISPFTSDE